VRPEDKLGGDLGLGEVDGLEGHHLDAELHERFCVSVLELFKSKDPSVREVIEYISRRLPEYDPAVHGRPANPWWNTTSIGVLILATLLAAVFLMIAFS